MGGVVELVYGCKTAKYLIFVDEILQNVTENRPHNHLNEQALQEKLVIILFLSLENSSKKKPA